MEEDITIIKDIIIIKGITVIKDILNFNILIKDIITTVKDNLIVSILIKDIIIINILIIAINFMDAYSFLINYFKTLYNII